MADHRSGTDLRQPAAPSASERTVVLFLAVVVGLSILLFALVRIGVDARGAVVLRDGSGLTAIIAGGLGEAVAGLAYRGEIYDLVELVLYSLLSIGLVCLLIIVFRDRGPDDPLTRAQKRIAGRWRLTLAGVPGDGASVAWKATLVADFAPAGDFRIALSEPTPAGLDLRAGEVGLSAHPTAERMRMLFLVEGRDGEAAGRRYLVEMDSRRDEDDGRIMFAGHWFRLGGDGDRQAAAGAARLVSA